VALEDPQRSLAQVALRVVDRVVADADLIVGVELLFLPADAIRHDLDHHIGRLAEFPDQIRAVPLLEVPRTHGHVQAQHRVGNHRRLVEREEQPHVGECREGSAVLAGPGGIEAVDEKALLLLREDVVHGLVILGHQVGDIWLEVRIEPGGPVGHRQLLSRRRSHYIT